jgi:hypothetical protein
MADQDLARRESVAIRAVRRRVLTRWIANPSLSEEKAGFWGDYRGTS